VFELDQIRVCHVGDFGQSSLRSQQAGAIGTVDLLFVPVGGGPTIGAAQAAEITRGLEARWVIPLHYRTPRVNCLETADAFLDQLSRVQRIETPRLQTNDLGDGDHIG
jgi:L-ascorbate metabolism protein UlaG (beta-lactamase superfamily)